MRIVNKRNIVSLPEKPRYNAVEMIKDMLILFFDKDSPIIDDELREKLLAVLDKYDKTKLLSISQEDETKIPEPEKGKIAAVIILKNSLARIIRDEFKPQVLKFLKKYSKINQSEFGRLENFMDTIVQKWSSDDLHKISMFIKSSVDDMTRIFPNMLLTNVPINNRLSLIHI